MKKETDAIEEEIVEMVYYMKGSITYDEAWNTTHDNRKIIRNVLNKIIQKESGNK